MACDALRLDIAGLAKAYASGEHTPEGVLDALFAAIEADTRQINAFCLLDRESARAAALASGLRWRAGRAIGPLDGVPVSIKDLMNVAGWPTRRGSLASAGEPPAAADSPAVALLRAAGGVIFGKTTTTEFGWNIGSRSPQGGLTRNPVDPLRSTGGSSSGAAAQAAAGWGPLALGSDAGGSVRIPASYCGLVGFKPTFGAIPLAPQSAFAEFAHLGPFTRSVEDCELAMQVLSQADARDPSSLFARGGAGTVRPLSIGWTLQLGADMQVAPAIAEAFHALVEQLGQAGHTLVPLPAEGTDMAPDMWTVWASRVHESFLAWTPAQRALLEGPLQQLYQEGATLDAGRLSRSRIRLRDFTSRLAQQFSRIDLLLTPATPTVAPPIADGTGAPVNWFADNGFSYPFNLTQQPALSLPLGRDADRLPFGLQIVGRKYEDARVLAIGREVESLLLRGPAA